MKYDEILTVISQYFTMEISKQDCKLYIKHSGLLGDANIGDIDELKVMIFDELKLFRDRYKPVGLRLKSDRELKDEINDIL